MSEALEQLRQLYFRTTKATIENDFDTAIDLFKSILSEEERDRSAVYMEGLAQMRSEWASNRPKASSAPRALKRRGRSGPSKGGGRPPR